ncbi:NAD(P)H-dependent glycerol-3-phosphate dehydrogenase [Crenobacter sp. SG2303]|uniref:Glycerol-3-phosphate dehydrogenase [NAD(P)+] n=1 Tax=Crenobacter oryzisoli TaxID=3056844 RepID=A0ABT7XRT9_9NEIS|nr:NAD(P)H-dependent glycerol-3-phosphate dehydrogenase [Crenobacter sp. SG2303]MDN0076514.1 NAD(P)H-dependent glycerol-3-phosphate dehydrogenase [Crenobacter sp. SG2303]
MKLAVLGAGAWGTALAIDYARDHQVTLWARNAEQVAEMADSRVNTRYLPDAEFPPSLALSADLADAVAGVELILLVTPIAGFRPTLRALAATGQPVPPILWACKGFEAGSGLLPHQVLLEELPGLKEFGVLSGPSFAREVALGLPAAVTVASHDYAFAKRIARELNSSRLRLYANDDLIGVEVGAAVKNVMAIATGVADGLGSGLNARAALITRGLAEVTRLVVALGGKAETMMGLAGMGDLILTCTGALSRNRQVGLKLAEAKPLAVILQELGHVAEGVPTAYEVQRLARELNVAMPITDAVCQLLSGSADPQRVVAGLMAREPKSESGDSLS